MNFIFTGCSVLLAVTTAVAVPLEPQVTEQHHHYGNGLTRDYYSPYRQNSPYYQPYGGQYYQPYGGQYYQPYDGYYGNYGGYDQPDYDGYGGIPDDYYISRRYGQRPIQSSGYGSYGSPVYYKK